MANPSDEHHQSVRLLLISVLVVCLVALLAVALLLVIRQLRLSAGTITITTTNEDVHDRLPPSGTPTTLREEKND